VTRERLDPARTCLLLFDLLEGHVDRDDASRERYRPVIANAAALLAAARSQNAMVAYAHADHRADLGTTPRNRARPMITGGTPQARIIAELAPQPEEYRVPKHRWSAFHGTYLDLALRTRGADTIVLCGGSTDVGIASTAFAARDLDYDLVIAADACTSPEQDNHAQFMQRIFPRLARVLTTAEIVALLA
jgi:nicotinamidase-related amidase